MKAPKLGLFDTPAVPPAADLEALDAWAERYVWQLHIPIMLRDDPRSLCDLQTRELFALKGPIPPSDVIHAWVAESYRLCRDRVLGEAA